MNRERIHVGILISPVEQLGIHHYLTNLLAAVHALPGAPIEAVVFTGRRYGANAADFAGATRIQTSLLDRKSPAWWLRQVLHRVLRRDVLIEYLLRRHGVQVLSHSGVLGKRRTLPTIGWIADLQHMRLPQMFTAEQLTERDLSFRRLCAESDTVIVSSQCGLDDLRAFAPAHAHKGRVLRFASGAASIEDATPMQDLRERYALNAPYLLLPNQFWPHKNHTLVVQALRLLRQRGRPVLVVCTGSTKGLPGSSTFADVMRAAEEAGVATWFRVLGIVPKADLGGLMRHAVAWINPSHFEGWSTSVEESKSLGKTILLSSIPVHVEQAPKYGLFFSPDDAPALADAMEAAVTQHNEAEDWQREDSARRTFAKKMQQFGEGYRDIVEETLRR